MPRIAVVITARPSYSRVRTALESLRARPDVTLQLILAASALSPRHGDVAATIRADGFVPAAELDTLDPGDDGRALAHTAARTQLALADAFARLQPDLVVTVADRFETLATAAAAAIMHLPLAHIQGGEVSGNIDDKIRDAVTQLADYHLVATDTARDRVRGLGADPACVFLTGCPSVDLAATVAAEELAENAAAALDPRRWLLPDTGGALPAAERFAAGYVVLLQHPVSDEAAVAQDQVAATLEALRELGLPVLCAGPNADGGHRGLAATLDASLLADSAAAAVTAAAGGGASFHRLASLSPLDFLRLLRGCRLLVGNSSVGIRECSYLGVPTVNIGRRQTGRERGPNVLDAAPDAVTILAAARRQLAHGPYPGTTLYGDGAAGPRIADCLVAIALASAARSGIGDSLP